MDHLYNGGHWIKKRSVIAKENGKSIADLKNASPDGRDFRKVRLDGITVGIHSDHIARKPANIDDYFYIPDLGYYYKGSGGTKGHGAYWSSTPIYDWSGGLFPHFDRSAYRIYLFGTTVKLGSFPAEYGCSRLWPADR